MPRTSRLPASPLVERDPQSSAPSTIKRADEFIPSLGSEDDEASMTETDSRNSKQTIETAVLIVSLALLYFAVPHTLEDFASGEPLKKGVPAPLLAALVSSLLAAQAYGLYALGRRKRRGLWIHLVLGLVWPIAAGFAQLPVILGPEPYRDGAVSVAYVVGLIIGGPLLVVLSALGLRHKSRDA